MDDVQTISDVIDDAPKYEESTENAIKRLAKLKPIEYERVRKNEAEKLGLSRVTFLDKLVEGARLKETKTGQDGGLKLYEPDPWPEEVDGDDLLNRIVVALRHYVVLPEHVAEAAALWAVHTHAFDLWQVTPRLAISAPTMGSGKSVMLDVLASMVPRPLEAANLSTAVVFRAVENFRPTLMIDEVDTFLGDNDELRGVLNSGYRKGGTALRCEGDNHELKAFSTFAPVATAGIGRLPGTLADRSIHAELQRKRPDEHVSGFRSDRIDHLRELSRQMARFVLDNKSELSGAEPTMPPGIFNRKADNWRPLLSIADIAGGEWPARARAAAVALSTVDADDAESLKVQLLSDIKSIFEAQTEDRMPTKDLVAALHELEERPWNDFRRGKPLSTRQLGDMLRSFKIVSTTIRFANGRVAKGYRESGFKEAFSRYLGDSAVTTLQVNETAGYGEFPTVTSNSNVTAEHANKPNVSAGCNVVTAQKGGTPEFNENPVNSCVYCNQPIEPSQETTPLTNGEVHYHCYEDWYASMPPRDEMS